MKEYKRNCPVCNKELFYSDASSLWHSKNRKCASCASKGRKCGPVPEERKEKISEGLVKYFSIHTNPFKGKQHSDEAKAKNREKHLGRPAWNKGIPCSEEQKRMSRITSMEAMLKKVFSTKEDVGSFDYFYNLNPSIITEYPLRDLGYIVDGYDLVSNVVYEYDTPYHRHVKEKDLIRQNNIIDYFKSIDNPLDGFVRIDSETKVQRKVG